uniref:Uncharacterized protein n=1 Tax=Arundo donax TaxID=35708 RepID=A0A0A9CXL6_ARUDO
MVRKVALSDIVVLEVGNGGADINEVHLTSVRLTTVVQGGHRWGRYLRGT